MIALPPFLLLMSAFTAGADAAYIQPRGANHLVLLAFSLVVMVAAIVLWIFASAYRSKRPL